MTEKHRDCGACGIQKKKMQRQLRRIKTAAMPKAPQSPQEFINTFPNDVFKLENGMCECVPEKAFPQTAVMETDFA